MSPRPPLELVEGPDPAEVHARFRVLQDEHQRVMARAWLGALVNHFTNEELRTVLIHHLNIGDVLDLRRLGILRDDEGWTGGPIPTRPGKRPGTRIMDV